MPGFSNFVSVSGKYSIIYVRPCGKVTADLTGGHVECNTMYSSFGGLGDSVLPFKYPSSQIQTWP
jgi:hypothetical protein